MKRREYLEQALRTGLMFTGHDVRFAPTEDPKVFAGLFEQILPLLHQKLASLGRSFDFLSEGERQVLMMGLGAMSGSVPMICLTEVPAGRSIDVHQATFGGYGLVISRRWVELNGGDKVLYVGHNSTASRRLFLLLATLKIFSLHLGANGQVLFENNAFRASLDLLCYVERRDYLEEAEWRQTGNPGWMGGTVANGTRLHLPIDEIEFVLVTNDADVKATSTLVQELAVKQKSKSMPKTIVFPRQLP